MNSDKLFSFHEQRTEIPDLGSLFYETTGSGPLTLVLLHGFPFDRRLWYKIIPYLPGLRIIIPDMPGVGNSKLYAPTLSMDDYARCVLAMLSHQQVSTCVLAGHSMGGYIALAFAKLFPEKLAGLSLVHSASFADDEARLKKREQVISFIEEHGAAQFARSFIPGPFAPGYQNDPEINSLIRWSEECTGNGLIAATRAMMQRPDSRHVLREAKFPVQFIIGESDPVIQGAISLSEAAATPMAMINLLESCGHMGMIEQTEKMAEALLDFCGLANG